jgi:hypothetical protein
MSYDSIAAWWLDEEYDPAKEWQWPGLIGGWANARQQPREPVKNVLARIGGLQHWPPLSVFDVPATMSKREARESVGFGQSSPNHWVNITSG